MNIGNGKNNLTKYRRLMFSAMILVVFAIIAYKLIDNVDVIFKWIGLFLSGIWKIIVPFVIGAFLAFILHSAVNFLETDFSNLFTKGRQTRWIRVLSVATVYVIAISLISIATVYLVPAIKDSVVEFKNNLPSNLEKADALLQKVGIDFQNDFNIEAEITNAITGFVMGEGNVVNLLGNIASFTSAFINGILGVIISCYILLDKENLGSYIKKLFLSIIEKTKADKFFEFCDYVTKTFDKFIIGKVLDSVIIGLISYLGFLLLGIKYRLIFAVIIGITNIIPYFGPFMGAIPVGILVFLYDPKMTIPVLLFIFILQQFDGSILGPKVLGDAIGVKPMEVIFAILVGGELFGVLGMFLAVPTYVVIAEFVNKIIDSKYKKRVLEKEGKKDE